MKEYSENSLNPETIDRMLKIASKKLGVTPEQLKTTLNDPQKANELISSLDKKNGGGIKGAAEDPHAFENFLKSNPKAQKLFEELTGGKKG